MVKCQEFAGGNYAIPTGQTPVIFQEGTYAPGLTDGIHRWMGKYRNVNSLGGHRSRIQRLQ